MPKFILSLAEAFMDSSMWRMFARHWMAYFTFRWFGWPKLPKSRYFKVKEVAHAMDGMCGVLAFVSVDRYILNYKINHLLTGTKWGHAGYVYWGHDGELRIKHMINSGLRDDYLLDLFGELDGFGLLWIPFKDKTALEEFQRRVQRIDDAKMNVDYDYALRLEPETLMLSTEGWNLMKAGKKKFRMYCSEYVYTLVHELTVNPKLVPEKFMERMVFEPDDLYQSSDVLFEEIY